MLFGNDDSRAVQQKLAKLLRKKQKDEPAEPVKLTPRERELNEKKSAPQK